MRANVSPYNFRGEQHAAALEASLTSLESKLDALLASVEGAVGHMDQGKDESGQGAKPDASGKDGKDQTK